MKSNFKRIAVQTLVATLILSSLIASNGCGDKNKDALYQIARSLHRVANATARADEVTHRFYLDGVIDAHTAESVSMVLRDINSASLEFQSKARKYQTFDVTAQVDILRFASDARDFIQSRIADGSSRIKNDRARAEWRIIVNVAYQAFVTIVSLVRSAKPKPTPIPTPKPTPIPIPVRP